VSRVLETLKTFDPIGVFAADCRCPAAVAQRDPWIPPATLIANQLSPGDFALKSLCKVDLEDIQMIAGVED
jgi:DNA-directed RNA polymerase specialized sigma54-like protein